MMAFYIFSTESKKGVMSVFLPGYLVIETYKTDFVFTYVIALYVLFGDD